MRPELVENPVFLQYYERWQADPTSVVFAALSEIFRSCGMLDEAIKIASEGLKHHPNLISGRLALAKAYLAKGDLVSSKDEALIVLGLVPNHVAAKAILKGHLDEAVPISDKFEEEITEEMPLSALREDEEGSVSDFEAWHTVTMARILVSQGHIEKAKGIYKKILEIEPDNETAKRELKQL